mmetsp:Transcript_21613/g.71562  ORF Transcript_21613/g.71562 Transcript_21613/m.71562 type:complete len:107 (-) Transcript_21613:206-526(-)
MSPSRSHSTQHGCSRSEDASLFHLNRFKSGAQIITRHLIDAIMAGQWNDVVTGLTKFIIRVFFLRWLGLKKDSSFEGSSVQTGKRSVTADKILASPFVSFLAGFVK